MLRDFVYTVSFRDSLGVRSMSRSLLFLVIKPLFAMESASIRLSTCNHFVFRNFHRLDFCG